MNEKGYLGIDVSKGYADFLLLDQHKGAMEEGFQLQDNPEGRKQLQSLIEQWFAQGMRELCCAVESTGGYEANWYSFLKNLGRQHPVKVARLNAKGVKAVSEAALRRTITDEVSAENIAVYLITFPEKVPYSHLTSAGGQEKYKDGRAHSGFIRMKQKQKVQLQNQLEKLLYQHFPEVLLYCRHGMPLWLLRMLQKYPCAAQVRKTGVAKLSALKGISEAKAAALLCKASASTHPCSEQIRHLIQITAREVLHCEEVLREEKDYLTDLFKEDAQVALLTSIKGLGEQSAVTLLIEIEDIARFDSAKKLTAYFGVHPRFKQSGDGTWGAHLSKQGRSTPRAVLYMAALSAIRCNPLLKALYARRRAEGMPHYGAMGVVMHKLLRIIYGVLKNQTDFDAAVDEKNQSRSKEKQVQREELEKETKKIKQQRKHRYQVAAQDAPLSRRAAQKRKEQLAS